MGLKIGLYTVHAALKKNVNESPFVTVLTDESTDINSVGNNGVTFFGNGESN